MIAALVIGYALLYAVWAVVELTLMARRERQALRNNDNQ